MHGCFAQGAGSLLRVDSIALSFDDEVWVMQEAVEDRSGDGFVAEDVAP